jgi:Zn-dependent peptidase ImmA (M78 family)
LRRGAASATGLGARADQVAEQLVRRLGLLTPDEIDVEAIAAHLGCVVRFRRISGQEGHLLRTERMGLIVVGDHTRTSRKWRFVVAHELGHFLMHSGLDQFSLCTERDLHHSYRSNGVEAEASRFAASLLMPEAMFSGHCEDDRPDLNGILELATRFGTSVSATALRYVQFALAPCAVAWSEEGTVRWWSKSSEFPFFLKNGYRITSETYARDLHSGVAVPLGLMPVDGGAWSADSRAEGRRILEHSVALGGHGVLSILVDDEGGGGADEEAGDGEEESVEDMSDIRFR